MLSGKTNIRTGIQCGSVLVFVMWVKRMSKEIYFGGSNLDTINILGHDIVIAEHKDRDNKTSHFCGYVKLKGKLKQSYEYETFRDKKRKVIGIDTAHYWNSSQDKNQKYKDCVRQVTMIIIEHALFQLSNK